MYFYILMFSVKILPSLSLFILFMYGIYERKLQKCNSPKKTSRSRFPDIRRRVSAMTRPLNYEQLGSPLLYNTNNIFTLFYYCFYSLSCILIGICSCYNCVCSLKKSDLTSASNTM